MLVARLSLNQTAYPDAARRNVFYERVVAGVHAATGPRGVAFANAWPLQAAPMRDVGLDVRHRRVYETSGIVGLEYDVARD